MAATAKKSKLAKLDYQNKQNGVLCRCDVFYPFGARGVAQMAMGHTVEMNCPCGLHFEVEQLADRSYEIQTQVEGHVFKAGSKSVNE